MQTQIELIKNAIREQRPNLAKNSVTTYASLLKSVYLVNHREVDSGFTPEWFLDPDNAIQAVKDKPLNTRKSMISAITVLVGNNNIDKRLTKMMTDDSETVQKQYDSGKMTDKQKENWISFEEVERIENNLLQSVKSWFSQTTPLTADQIRIITDWLLLALTSGIYFPPRRSEWTLIKLQDVNPETDNYIDFKRGLFVLNQYKTSKLYGTEEIPFPKLFASLLQKYIRLFPDNYYLFENNGTPFTSSYITFRLNRIFGKKVSTSMLRHIWTSSKYPDMPNLEELKDNARKMGHSVETHLAYAVR